MKLKRLTLENFRGFEHLEIEFHPQLTVLVGVNGSGKTSVLEALIVMLNKASSDAEMHLGRQWIPAAQRLGTRSFRLDLRLGHDDDEVSFVLDPSVAIDRAPRTKAATMLRTTAVCAYSVRRDVARPFHDTENLRRRDRSPLSDLNIGLSPAAEQWLSVSDFSDFFEWFLDQEDIENERRLDDPQYRDPRLEATRNAIEQLIPGYSSLRVRRARSSSGPRLTLKKNDQELDFTQLSEGERTLTALGGDIARRTASGQSTTEREADRGVVIIDEIDLHLHPQWQANVLPALLRTFPDIQFVVTTHSPIVLSHVDSECVRLLRDFQLVPVPPTHGRDPNSVLSEVFEVPLRPAKTQALLDRIAALIDQEQLEQAKAEIHRLGQDLGQRDLEVTRLRGLVELMEV
ncbi:MAG: AAA family ATPase [Myxococcota bacterium]